MTTLQLVLLMLAGIVAGFCNTIAGGGSMFVVPLMIFMGLPATVANASLRPAILAQNCLALVGFRRAGLLTAEFFRKVIPLVLCAVPASYLGARLVTEKMNDENLEQALAVVFIGLAIFMALWRPKPLLKTHRIPAYLLIIGAGFYGGFIQIGVGFLLITALLIGDRWTMAQAHAAKITIVGVYTLVTLPVFVMSGQMNWTAAIFLSLGQALGGYLGSRFATHVREDSLKKLYLVLMILFAIILAVR